jgi:hypothetical protein
MIEGTDRLGMKSNETGTAKTIYEKENRLTLDMMQKIVGGYIELVYLPKSGRQMIVNEDGAMRGLLPNLEASNLFSREKGYCNLIQGDVIVLSGKAKIK